MVLVYLWINPYFSAFYLLYNLFLMCKMVSYSYITFTFVEFLFFHYRWVSIPIIRKWLSKFVISWSTFTPSTSLTKKDISSKQTLAGLSVLNNLKKIVTKALVVPHYKQSIITILEINFYDYANNRVFFQLGKDKLLHIVVFFFQNLNSTVAI